MKKLKISASLIIVFSVVAVILYFAITYISKKKTLQDILPNCVKKYCNNKGDFNDTIYKDGSYHYAISANCSSQYGKDITNCCKASCKDKEVCDMCPENTFYG